VGRQNFTTSVIGRARRARGFGLLTLCALLLFGSGGGGAQGVAGRAAGERPNFLFIYTDDHRWDALGVVQREQGARARFPWLKTPNLDRLAAEGVRFRNAFVVHSLCTPSRASFLTGQYTHRHEVMNNFTPFSADKVTHATLLREAGYRTGYVGKWHMGDQRGRRPGFDYSASYLAHGRYENCPFEVNGERAETRGWVDDVATDYAIEFLRANRGRAFSLTVGYKSPHNPFQPPARLREAFAGNQLKPPQNAGNKPPYLGKVHPATPEHLKSGGNSPVKDPLDYFRTIAGVDENVGRLMRALDELGLAANTLVVYASDNGYQLGEHGIGDKRAAYEESMRIPLIVRYPKLGAPGRAAGRGTGRVIDEMALNIDLAPTLLDFAGVATPRGMQGRSWRPLLAGRRAAWRRAFLYEYFFIYKDVTAYEIETSDPPVTPTIVAVRTADAKLIKYPGHEEWTELYDLRGDPYETRNLAASPAHRELLGRMKQEHARQVRESDFRIPARADKLPQP
jgi:arylsulfatase A-like enzyme